MRRLLSKPEVGKYNFRELLGDYKPSFYVLHCTGTGEIINKHEVNKNCKKYFPFDPSLTQQDFSFI